MKKLFVTLLAAAMLLVPVGHFARAEAQETAQVPEELYAQALSAQAPAQMSVPDAMAPAIHAMLLAMMHQQAAVFDHGDPVLAWEAIYNLLSLYGQLDGRAELNGGTLTLPSESVNDFAAALALEPALLGQPGEDLCDRMCYVAESDLYLLSCGEDDLADVVCRVEAENAGEVILSGELVYLVDDTPLCSFRARLQMQDNMFGYCIAGLELV